MTPFVEARQLVLPGDPVARPGGLDFDIGPGLSVVLGGEGRGKSTLLRLLAGEVPPAAGRLQRHAATVCLQVPSDAAHDRVPASAWLAALRPRFPDWDRGAEAALVEAFGLAEHIDKPMYMLSTGSRRKVGLVGAASARAVLTLLDAPFAALDQPSIALLTELLAEAAGLHDRAWVLADYALPAGLAGAGLSTLIALGD